jgi:predicted TIM-barrel fold metal-dependent hydrolase
MNRTGPLTRREALAIGVAAMSLTGLTAGADDAGWIDAHSHIWTPDTDRFPLASGQTKADLKPPSFTDDELMAVAGPEGVKRVVLIQHSIYYRFDNAYMLDAARRHPQRFRIVGMVDDTQPRPGEAMRRLLAQRVTGFRITPAIHKEAPERWLDTPGMHEMWETAAATRQAMCCLIHPHDLPGVGRMCAKHPDTPVVIDHFARIGHDGQFRDADVQALCRLARFKQVCVKVSAFYALGQKKPPYLELVPLIRRLFDAFGPQRLMWASDSPYQLQGGNTYGASISLVRDRLDFAPAENRQWLLRKTADRVFFFA